MPPKATTRSEGPWHLDAPTGRPHRTGSRSDGAAPPHPTAATALRHVAVTAAVGVAASLVTVVTMSEDGRLSWSAVAAVLAVGGAGIVAIVVAAQRFGEVFTRELLSGYVTVTFTAAAWWITRRHPERPRGWVHWDFTSIDVVAPDGRVTDPARPGLPPPGFYTSPHLPGRLELWTGSQWTRYYLPVGRA